MNKFKILLGVLALIFFYACKDYESIAPNTSIEIEKYDGTLLEYLSDAENNRLRQKFDSMLVVINGIPGLKEQLEKEDEFYTVFAVPNVSFERAFVQLNDYRAQNKLGGQLSFDDLLIEPFTVEHTIEEGSKPIIIINKYDYRSQVDSLFCRYIIPGEYTTDVIQKEKGGISIESFKNRYLMNLSCSYGSASGIVNEGARVFEFSDMNDSQLKEIWKTTNVVWQDIHTRNGVIHILTNEHNFSYGKFINYFQNRGNEFEYEKQ